MLNPPGQIRTLVKAIQPAIERVRDRSGNLLDNAVGANIEFTVSKLKTSSILAESLKAGKIRIVGARYDLNTGVVNLTVS
jgi:carbonic anhydrase